MNVRREPRLRLANQFTPCDTLAIRVVLAAVALRPRIDRFAARPPAVGEFGPVRLRPRSSAEPFGSAPAPDRLWRDGRAGPACGVERRRHRATARSIWCAFHHLVAVWVVMLHRCRPASVPRGSRPASESDSVKTAANSVSMPGSDFSAQQVVFGQTRSFNHLKLGGDDRPDDSWISVEIAVDWNGRREADLAALAGSPNSTISCRADVSQNHWGLSNR
jgi:hypothetical protein